MQRDLFNNNYKDIYVSTGRVDFRGTQFPVFCYRTGLTVYEESFDNGRLVSAGWNTSGTPLNVLEDIPVRLNFEDYPEPFAFSVEVNGECLDYDWDYVGFEKSEEYISATKTETLHGIITLKSRIYPLTVEVHTILSGSAIFTRYITLKNESDQPMKINKLIPMSGGMETFEDWDHYFDGDKDKFKVFSLGYMDTDKACAEGAFRWHEMPSCGTVVSGKFKSDRFRYPMFMISNNALGHIYFGQMAFTGGYEMYFNLNITTAFLLVRMKKADQSTSIGAVRWVLSNRRKQEAGRSIASIMTGRANGSLFLKRLLICWRSSHSTRRTGKGIPMWRSALYQRKQSSIA